MITVTDANTFLIKFVPSLSLSPLWKLELVNQVVTSGTACRFGKRWHLFSTVSDTFNYCGLNFFFEFFEFYGLYFDLEDDSNPLALVIIES
jgi:hypothetical protein